MIAAVGFDCCREDSCTTATMWGCPFQLGILRLEAIERTLADESIITSLFEEIQRGSQIFADECNMFEDALNSVYCTESYPVIKFPPSL